MALIERVQSILLRPKETWPVIAAEGGDVASIYSGYLVILAAIPAVAGFIGRSIIGVGGFGISYRVPILTGLLQMVVTYVVMLALLYVVSLVVNALAPTFGGTKNPVQALKLVAYSVTGLLVGCILLLIPSTLLSLVILLALAYSIYLFYLGTPVLMRCPPDKAGAYTAVVAVCWLVIGLIFGAVMSMVVPMGHGGLGRMGAMGAGTDGNVTIQAPNGANVTINSSGMAEMAKRMEDAGKRMESAQKSGDSAAAGKAMGEMMGAITGGNGVPIASSDLKSLLPESVGDMKRTAFEASGNQAMGIAVSNAKASYSNGERNLNLSITDTGGLAGMAALAGWANMTMDKETDGKVEKVYKDGARTMHEEYQKDGSRGEVTVILANGVIVEADGNKMDVDSLKKVIAGVDLGKIEAMKRAAK